MVKIVKNQSPNLNIATKESQPLLIKRFKAGTKDYTDNNNNGSTNSSIANMVERFVQSISHINDSGSFDTSFEVKHIQSPQLVRHRCVTELDRENLMKFVREFEARQSVKSTAQTNSKSTPKNSPFFCRKLLASIKKSNGNNYVNASVSPEPMSSSSSTKNYVQFEIDEVQQSNPAAMQPPAPQMQRSQPERSSLRSAAKVLQFFSKKKPESHPKEVPSNAIDSSRSSSANTSPVLMRHTHLGLRPLNSDAEDICDDDDDGISSAGSNFTQASNSNSGSYSRNDSPDSSFEMHAPLVPSFKVTPPPNKLHRNPAYEFARFIRGSFHAKRASVTKLRRSISDPDNSQQLNYDKINVNDVMNAPKPLKTVKQSKKVLGDATNLSHSDVIRNRALPANASPFRRAWGQSSFRTPRADKHTLQPSQQHHQHDNNNAPNSPPVRRTASMNASDNDVYIKSMDNYLEELKHTHSQQHIAADDRHHHNSSKSKSSHVNFSSVSASADKNKTAADIITTCSQKPPPSVGPVGVSAWGTSFERLLEDPAGLHTFAEFLKKEFSAENIYFWTACERFRLLDNETERASQAIAIFSKHLANGSPEPVNVDSQARNLTEEKLQSAERDIFAQAQKQIFNLMKFDSYQRFIRSDMYKSCLEAEAKNQTLPYAAEDLDELLKTNFPQAASSTKLKKSASNAEDRRRKSLLPWHRKTRCKSRDRAEPELGGNKLSSLSVHHASSKMPQLSSSSSLKIPSTQNSMSDVHSSRSSLSSFDALPIGSGAATHAHEEIKPCSLCRVILSDGATTIVQTRPGDTVGHLVERLLEKRGLSYAFYDVVINGSTKSIDLQSPALETLAGKEVLIEQRVAFKLDLPDPKVISVKSKPKKQLQEVIRPILQKYNYCMDAVRVLKRDTHEQLDLSLPVTVADGQRLQIVLIKAPPPPPALLSDYQNALQSSKSTTKHTLPKSGVSFANTKVAGGSANTNQSTLDEITNKVFNELLQSKVEAHAMPMLMQKQQLCKASADMCSLKSDDCASETSSIFDRGGSNILGTKSRPKKKHSNSSSHSDETININAASQAPNSEESSTSVAQIPNATTACVKKPIIAKLKAGVKLQVTERVAENQDALLEGLKRAQLARLEDQRGTEINFELPDFLKNKENMNAANKLRKVRANLCSINKNMPSTATPAEDASSVLPNERPQPAPRLSITLKNNKTNISPMKIDEEDDALIEHQNNNRHVSNAASLFESDYVSARGPPPLPPKPKVLPIKPPNWGVTNATTSVSASHNKLHSVSSPASNICINNNGMSGTNPSIQLPSKIPIDISRKHLSSETGRCAYLEEPSSSFV